MYGKFSQEKIYSNCGQQKCLRDSLWIEHFLHGQFLNFPDVAVGNEIHSPSKHGLSRSRYVRAFKHNACSVARRLHVAW
jgi:hypothetical protein